ncbi:nucleoside 2-deoxyribosyltransferase [Marinobacter sp. M1N3S26]|uniref:nucleoside 2-deoxyribosyltransferase n=1 Tax=unclassified Marinobacter TaxID=83889 RepID=UPI00387B10C7
MPDIDTPAIYLAGPEVFLDEDTRTAIITEKQSILWRMGMYGLDPMDNELWLPDDTPPAEKALAIYQANKDLMDRCDGALVNLTPFRGPSADAGTVFESGYLAARGTPMIGYTLSAEDYQQRVPQPGLSGVDDQGRAIEQFGLMDNLMIEAGILGTGGEVFRGTQTGIRHGELFDAVLFETSARALWSLLER